MANNNANQNNGGDMTVREAGHKGGQKVKKLIQKGEQQDSSM